LSGRFAQALPYGAELLGAETARFSIWAPGADEVYLEIEGAEAQPMLRDEDGTFHLTASCTAGACYRYRLGNGQTVPDPAARAQADDVNGLSVVVDPKAYEWAHETWGGRPWHESVIYEVHAGCFGGGFSGVRERLPQLLALGVTALELMPIADFSGRRNWGYDGVLPYAPDQAYGSPDELKRLIDEAHGLGLCVYLDVVYNHFGPDGNYLHTYAPQFFDAGQSSPWGPAIDFKRPQVREFFIANALYWLMEYRFDGLRLDAVHAIGDNGFLDELAARVRRAAEPGRHIHLVLENERNDAQRLEPGTPGGYDAQWNDDFHNVLHVLLTGEHDAYYANYREAPAQKLARALAEGFIYQGEPSPTHHGEPRGMLSGHLPPTSFVGFLQNHDQVGNRAMGERLGLLAAPQALRAAVTLHLMAPHIPLIFMGEDFGASQPFLFFTDFHDELADAVREGRRKEFAAFAAFADERRRATIPDPNALATFQASSLPAAPETPEQMEHQQFYRRLLQLRREVITPTLAAARSLGAEAVGPAAVVGQWRLGDGSKLWIGLNLGQEPVQTEAPAGSLLCESCPGCAGFAAAGVLQPQSCCVFLEPLETRA
jgi:maltooligosyltrehalose trehalohydrolase